MIFHMKFYLLHTGLHNPQLILSLKCNINFMYIPSKFKCQLNLMCNINFMYIPSKFKCQLNLKCNINFMYIPSKYKCQLSFN